MRQIRPYNQDLGLQEIFMGRRDGSPLWITEGQEHAKVLRRADLGAKADLGRYDEDWLQRLLHGHPEIFPIEQIEPGFGDLTSLCRELPLNLGGRWGALDNLFATRDGGLVLVEAKLWRNPEARRSAVAQAMEYAAAVFRMNYSELQSAVLKARGTSNVAAASLYEIVAGSSDVDEADFIDAVSLNLTRGRAVIAVVGDGIREDIVPLANLLQSHAGHRFTFALVELAIYETPNPQVRLVVPSILAQTTLIERGVVRIEGNGQAGLQIEIVAPPVQPTSAAPGRRISLSEDEFFEQLAQRGPNLPNILRNFLTKAETLNVYTELKGGMSLKHSAPEGQPLNMGTITKDGFIDTGPSTWWGRKPMGQIYNETLAERIGGHVNSAKNGEESALRTANWKTPRLSDLLPQHEQVWLDAMDRYIRENLAASSAQPMS
jgi:hypothetical protein